MARKSVFRVTRYRQSYNADCFGYAHEPFRTEDGASDHRPKVAVHRTTCPHCGTFIKRGGHGEAGLILFAAEQHTVIDRNGEEVRLLLEPHQKRILREMTRRAASGDFVYRFWIYATPKKSGKSEIGGLLGAWAGITFGKYNEVYFAANSREQATLRAFAAATRCFDENKALKERYDVATFKSEIRIGYLHSFIRAASSDYGSMAGANPGMVIWDELWAFNTTEDERLWSELAPSPTRSASITVVVTYAGFENESKLLWDLYLKGVGTEEHEDGQGHRLWADVPAVYVNGPIFCYWEHLARMPWHTTEWLESERLRCPGLATWLRQYENRWVRSTNAFITEPQYKAIVDKELGLLPEHQGHTIAVGVDLGIKHDSAAVLAVWRDAATQKVKLARHQIWIPPEGSMLDIEETVEAFLLELHAGYTLKGVWYDPFQMARSAQTLTKVGLPMVEYSQTEQNLTQATNTLYRMIRSLELVVYEADDLREHMINAVTIEGARGMRLKKEKTAKKIDGAVALSMAVACLEEMGEDDADFSFGTLAAP